MQFRYLVCLSELAYILVKHMAAIGILQLFILTINYGWSVSIHVIVFYIDLK